MKDTVRITMWWTHLSFVIFTMGHFLAEGIFHISTLINDHKQTMGNNKIAIHTVKNLQTSFNLNLF